MQAACTPAPCTRCNEGKLHAKAQQRTGKAGRPFVTAKVTTTAKDGNAQFVNVIAFALDACNALLALGAGASLWATYVAAPSPFAKQ